MGKIEEDDERGKRGGRREGEEAQLGKKRLERHCVKRAGGREEEDAHSGNTHRGEIGTAGKAMGGQRTWARLSCDRKQSEWSGPRSPACVAKEMGYWQAISLYIAERERWRERGRGGGCKRSDSLEVVWKETAAT